MLLGAAAQAGRGPQRRLGVLCDAAQHEVEVGGGGHGVEDVGFVRDEELWGGGNTTNGQTSAREGVFRKRGRL